MENRLVVARSEGCCGGVMGVGVMGRYGYKRVAGRIFVIMETFYIFTVVMVAVTYTCGEMYKLD